MNAERHAFIRIEDALDHEPVCTCGRPMTITTDADGFWLTCSALTVEPTTGGLRRTLGRLTGGVHTRRHLLDPIQVRASLA